MAIHAAARNEVRARWLLGLLCLLAVFLRVGYAVHMGADDFWSRGYFYYEIAQNIAAGKGILRLEGGLVEWAIRPPLYPLFLTPAALFGGNYLLIVVPQAVLGAGTVLCAFLIGRLLFGTWVGVIAAALTTIYPFNVVHDTALQETGMQTFFAALSVYLLLLAREGRSAALWLAAGITLGLTVLVRGMMLPFAICALAWIGLLGSGGVREKTARALLVSLAFAAILGIWLGRNEMLVGRPVLSSESGQLFWVGHNSQTFSRYPEGSIDRSSDQGLALLSPDDKAELAARDEVGRSDWWQKRGMDYLRQHPGDIPGDALRKVGAGFSWRFNPSPTPLKQLIYFVSYTPIAVLGFLGMILGWRRWRDHSLIYLQFLCFVLVAAVYFAHTNHRTYLDVYWIVFAAALIGRVAGLKERPISEPGL